MNESPKSYATKGFPLGALFLLVAVFATIVTQLCLLKASPVATDDLAFATGFRAVCGGIFGLMIGLHDFRRSRAAAVGISIGLLAGAATGPIALLSIADPATALMVASASGIGLIVLATIYRRLNSHDPVSARR